MYNACMVALQIRDVPDDVRESLADLAAARGQSMQAFLLALVTDEARRSTNLALLDRFEDRRDGSQLTASDIVHVVDHERAEREAHLGRVLGESR